jgi:hypothetical protein
MSFIIFIHQILYIRLVRQPGCLSRTFSPTQVLQNAPHFAVFQWICLETEVSNQLYFRIKLPLAVQKFFSVLLNLLCELVPKLGFLEQAHVSG